MVSSKKLYLSLLTGVIFSSIITLNCQTEAGEQEDPNSLNSSIIGQLDGIPIGSTVKYVWKDQVLKTTTVCTVSERAPEAGDTQDSKCWIQPHGGWAVPPVVSSSDYFPTGGTKLGIHQQQFLMVYIKGQAVLQEAVSGETSLGKGMSMVGEKILHRGVALIPNQHMEIVRDLTGKTIFQISGTLPILV